jgi:hypothetical protein
LAVSKDSEAFDAEVMSADLAKVRGLIRSFFGQVKAEDWERPTESRPTGWTLKQAFCHIVAAAEMFDKALEGIFNNPETYLPPLRNRKELSAFNQREIEQRQDLPPEYLLQIFLESLVSTESRVEKLSQSDFEKPVPLNVYNRPLSVAELIGNQLAHPVLVHGAQLANGIGVDPLWRSFSADLMQRQLTRFFHIMSHSYWPERGGKLTAVINFNIRGSGGGHWHIRLDSDGGSVGKGQLERPSLTLHFANPDAFCSLFTVQLSPMRGLLTRKVFAWGNIPLAFKLSRLFAPT